MMRSLSFGFTNFQFGERAREGDVDVLRLRFGDFFRGDGMIYSVA